MPRTQEQHDFYAVLGVPRDADPKSIQKAFHDHARRVHPDVSDDPDADERFSRLQQAYEVLSNPRSRILYDRLAYRGPGGGGFGPVHPGIGHPTPESEHISDHELLSWIFGEAAPAPAVDADRPKDDPLVLALAAVAFVTAVAVMVVFLLT